MENTELIDQILTEKLKEEDEKKKRCNNLIIFGVKETEALDSAASSQKDREEVAKIFFQIKIKEEEIKLIRLGKKKADQKRPLLITVRDEKTKWHVISRGKMLRGVNEFDGIFISPDLTNNERKWSRI